ncbi:WD repeat domain 65 [Perkinsus chesapeaki]|uniref:WD repeat domain 65 n=1 Tax=Perkinsus chesapeaki TaxID=330153 RepID=A0A7J6M158_PERCH|nr:WD repeat domain 65 [Perkinsus chesapeaki]
MSAEISTNGVACDASHKDLVKEQTVTRLQLTHALGAMTTSADGRQIRNSPAIFPDDNGHFVLIKLKTPTLADSDHREFLGEVHVCGRHACFRHIDSNTVNFLTPVDETCRRITAIAKSGDNRALGIAQILKGDQMAIGIYNPATPGNHAQDVILLPKPFKGSRGVFVRSIAFTKDDKALIILTSAGGVFYTTSWHQSEGRPRTNNATAGPKRITLDRSNSAHLELEGDFDKVTTCPKDNTLLCFTGPSGCKFVKYKTGGILKALSDQRQAAEPARSRICQITDSSVESSFTATASGVHISQTGLTELNAGVLDHAWLASALTSDIPPVVLITMTGGLFVISPSTLTLTHRVPCPLLNFSPRAISPLAQGFVIVGTTGGVTIWEEAESEGEDVSAPYKLVRNVTVVGKSNSSLESIDLCGSGEWLVCVTDSKEILVLSASSIYTSPSCWQEGCLHAEPVEATVLSGGFHSDAISGLSLCRLRQIMTTVSYGDKSMRIWRLPSAEMDLCRVFLGDEPLDVAVHPVGGFIIAMSFTEKLRIIQIVDRDIVVLQEFAIRRASRLIWSGGGHFLAVAHGTGVSGARQVTVFGMHRGMAKVATLKVGGSSNQGGALARGDTEDPSGFGGLMQSGIVALSFDEEDHHLAVATCESRGDSSSISTVTEWDCGSWSKTSDHSSGKGYVYTCLVYNNKRIFVGGLFIKSGAGGTPTAKASPLHLEAQGIIREIQEGEVTQEATPWPVFSGPQSGVPFASHRHTLVSAGTDGAIFFLNIGDPGHAHHGRTNSLLIPDGIETVSKGQLRATHEKNSEAEKTIAGLKKELKTTVSELNTRMEEKLAQARKDDRAEIQELRRRYNALQAASNVKESEALRVMRTLEAVQVEATEQLENFYERKLSQEAARHDKLEESRKAEVQRNETYQMQQQNRFKREKVAIQAEFEARLREARKANESSQDLIEYLKQRHETILEMEAKEREDEINQIVAEKDKSIQELTQSCSQYRKEQDALMKGLEAMEKEKVQLSHESLDAASIIQSLKVKVEEQSRRLDALKNENSDNVKSRQQKECEIRELRNKLEGLNQLKSVLEFRLKEMSESVGPKDKEIEELRNKLHDSQLEFERKRATSHNIAYLKIALQRRLETDLDHKSQLAAQHRNEVALLHEKIAAGESSLVDIMSEITTIVHNSSVKEWPNLIKKLYHERVIGCTQSNSHAPPGSNIWGDDGGVEEAQRQIRALDKRVNSLRSQSSRFNAASRRDLSRRATENATLISEINDTRVQKKNLEDQVKSLQLELRELRGKYQHSEQELRRTTIRTPLSKGMDDDKRHSGEKTTRLPKVASEKRWKKQREEDSKRMQELLQAVDRKTEKIQMQRLEIYMLQEQVGTLLRAKDKDKNRRLLVSSRKHREIP